MGNNPAVSKSNVKAQKIQELPIAIIDDVGGKNQSETGNGFTNFLNEIHGCQLKSQQYGGEERISRAKNSRFISTLLPNTMLAQASGSSTLRAVCLMLMLPT